MGTGRFSLEVLKSKPLERMVRRRPKSMKYGNISSNAMEENVKRCIWRQGVIEIGVRKTAKAVIEKLTYISENVRENRI